jgi:hypothetical protein
MITFFTVYLMKRGGERPKGNGMGEPQKRYGRAQGKEMGRALGNKMGKALGKARERTLGFRKWTQGNRALGSGGERTRKGVGNPLETERTGG